jgi:hypothetical protein
MLKKKKKAVRVRRVSMTTRNNTKEKAVGKEMQESELVELHTHTDKHREREN